MKVLLLRGANLNCNIQYWYPMYFKVKLTLLENVPGWATQQSLMTGKFYPEVHSITLLIPFLIETVALSYTFC